MDAASRVGTTIGHIRITRLVGAGGMGEVYEGYDETLRRTVAVKTIGRKAGLDPTARARFLREARALSALDHPNICTIFDHIEGDDNDFLVLEYIEGLTLAKAIDAGVDRAQALKIAEQVASVLVAAHERGVVHRDIKPSNVMVTADGDAKVLDFGLARLARPDDDEAVGDRTAASPAGPRYQAAAADLEAPTLSISDADQPPAADHGSASGPESVRTVRGSVLGTPIYMSPEQARGERATAASDMFSFGLLLRQLFTGRMPGREQAASSERGGAAATRAASSAPGLRGDLRALVERLESPAPGARPSAADTLARLRWIRGRPKRRLRRAVVAAAVVLALLGALKYTVDLRHERAQALEARDQAQELADFLIGLFEVSDPGEARGRTVTAREILRRGADGVAVRLEDQPGTRARLMETIGIVDTKLGLYEDAEPLLDGALEIAVETYGEESLEVSEVLQNLAVLYNRTGRYVEGEELARRSLAIREAELGTDSVEVAESAHWVGVLAERQSDHGEAEVALARAVAIRERVLGPDHPAVAESLRELGIVHQMLARYDQAERCYARSLAICERALAPDHPDVGASLSALASVEFVLGRSDDSQAHYRRALEIREQTLGPEHPDVALAVQNLAVLLEVNDQLEAAEAAYRRALAIQEKTLSAGHPEVASSLRRIGVICMKRDRLAEAEQAFSRAIAALEGGEFADSPQMAMALLDLSSFLDETHRYREANGAAERALAIQERTLEPDDPAIAESCFCLAHARHRHLGPSEDAEPYYARAVAILEPTMPADHGYLVLIRWEYAQLLRELGREAEAQAIESRIPPEAMATVEPIH